MSVYDEINKLMDEISKKCFEKENSPEPPMNFGSTLPTVINVSTISPCIDPLQLIRYNKLRNEAEGIKPNTVEPQTQSENSQNKKSSSESHPAEQSTEKKQPQKNNENSGPGFLSGLMGSVGKLKDKLKGDDKAKGDDKGKDDDKDKGDDKIVKGIDNLFKDKLNEKWFQNQQNIFLEEKDHNKVSNMQKFNKFFKNDEKEAKNSKKGTEEAEAKKGGEEAKNSKKETAEAKNSKKETEDDKIDDDIFKKYVYLYLTSFYSRIHYANKVNIIEHIIVHLLDEITLNGQNAKAATPNAKATTPNIKGGSQNAKTATPNSTNFPKINTKVFNDILGKMNMYLYTEAELKKFNVGTSVKDTVDKVIEKNKEKEKETKKDGGKKQNGNGMGDALAASLKRKKDAISEGISNLKNLTVWDSKFWIYDKNVLLIDIEEKSKYNIEKYKDMDSNDIANKIIKYLSGKDTPSDKADEIDKLDPKIEDKDFKDIALKIKYNKKIMKNKQINTPKNSSAPNIPIPKGPVVKDPNNLIKDDEKKQILKLILMGIKFMFELSLKGPGKQEKVEHKLKGFVDDFINDSYNSLIISLPLLKKGENDRFTHIKLDEEELKKAFECIVTEILTDKKSKDFPLIDKSEVKDNKKNYKYTIYNISKKGALSTLKVSCNIIIPDPKMDETKFKEQIKEYKIPPNIYTKEQEIFNNTNKYKVGETNLIYRMIEKMQILASNLANTTTNVPKANTNVPKANTNIPVTPVTPKGGKNITNKNKEYTFILGRKHIINKIGRSYYIKYNNQIITLTEAKSIERKLSKKSKKIHHFI